MTTTTERPAGATRRPRLDSRWLQEYGVYLAVVALLLFNLFFTPYFFTVGNLRTQLIQVTPVLIVSLGMALVIGTEGIDLSVGSVMALAAALLPLYLGYGPWVALVVALLGGLLCGLLSGTLVSVVGLQPIVATLVLLVGGRGMALVLADGQLKQINDPTVKSWGDGAIGPVPYIVVVALVVAVAIWWVVARTTFGRQLVAIGGNRSASRIAGLPVKRVLLVVYVISGVLAALAGVLASARLQASDPSTIGMLIELSAITAVVVGGTPLQGGKVRVLGTIAGAVLMQLLLATLIKHNISASVAQMVQAVIIVLAVYVARERIRR